MSAEDFSEKGLRRSLVEHEVPQHDHDGLVAWVRTARPMGDFLTAVVENDLRLAVFKADSTNRYKLHQICIWLYNFTPGACSGSPERVKKWSERQGLDGIERENAAIREEND